MEFLRAAGVEVTCGVREEECRKLNEAFVTFMERSRPFVTIKTAATLDGRTATADGDSRWITNERSRRFVHRLRSWTDAVMVGVETVLRDDPRLTCRLERGGKDPIRVVVDSRLRIGPEAGIFRTGSPAPTWVATRDDAPAERAARLEQAGARILRLPGTEGRVAVEPLLAALADENVQSVLLEGGATLNASFLRAGLVDKVLFFYAPKLLGGPSAKGMVGDLGVERVQDCMRFGHITVRRFGDDVMLEAYPLRPDRTAGTEGGAHVHRAG